MSREWSLKDAEELNKQRPDTFEISPKTERELVAIGDFVKLLFAFDKQVDGCGGERMWVEIIEKEGNKIKGLLRNSPTRIESLHYDDVVFFEPRHIVNILRGDR